MNAATELAASMRVSRSWYSRRALFLAPLALALCIATPLVYASAKPRDAAICPQHGELLLFTALFTLRVAIVCLGDAALAALAVNGDVAQQSCAVRTLLRIRASWAPSWLSLGVFLMGNIYVAQSSLSCMDTPAYRFALSLLLLEYLQLLLPLLCMCALLAAVCCCMPLLVRALVASGAMPSAQTPATSDEIARLPEHRYSMPAVPPADPDQCSICLEAYADGDAVRTLPCGHSHVFHKECVDNWLKISANCPVCRGTVLGRTPEVQNAPVTAPTSTATAPGSDGARAPRAEERASLLQSEISPAQRSSEDV